MQIKQDDNEIEQEGLENLSEDELRSACRARGMRAPFGEAAAAFMRRQMQDWLDLSLHRGLPSSLLLMSRAFTITASVKVRHAGAAGMPHARMLSGWGPALAATTWARSWMA